MTPSRELIGAKTGFIALTVAAIFIAAWLSLQNHRRANGNTTATALDGSADLVRFRADAWYLPNDPMLGFVEIPAGTFSMGSDPTVDRQAYATERWSADSYQGRVDLPTFYIGRFEVTVAAFDAFAAATHRGIDAAAQRAPATQAVANVSWTDALEYARWLDATLRTSTETPVRLKELLNAGYRVTLPSEAEWEKAARGTDGRIFPWGNTANPERANFRNDRIKPVGSVACDECAYGLSDMSGNVWELTRSPYQPYPFHDSATGNPQADALFVMRGGAYDDVEGNIRAAVRGGVDPGARRGNIGFRIVLSKP